MASLNELVVGYVESMRPRGLDLARALRSWPEGAGELATGVHKFAGSAGSAGFMRLSAVATLLEILLKSGDADPLTAAQIACLARDFADGIADLAPERSGLCCESGPASPFVPFVAPQRVVIAGLPEGLSRMLAHVVEQCLGIAWVLPEAPDLSRMVRAPDLALVGSDAAPVDASFPLVVFSARRFDRLTEGWPGFQT